MNGDVALDEEALDRLASSLRDGWLELPLAPIDDGVLRALVVGRTCCSRDDAVDGGWLLSEWLILEVHGASSVDVVDHADIGGLNINQIAYDGRDGVLRIDGGIPASVRVQVDGLLVRVVRSGRWKRQNRRACVPRPGLRNRVVSACPELRQDLAMPSPETGLRSTSLRTLGDDVGAMMRSLISDESVRATVRISGSSAAARCDVGPVGGGGCGFAISVADSVATFELETGHSWQWLLWSAHEEQLFRNEAVEIARGVVRGRVSARGVVGERFALQRSGVAGRLRPFRSRQPYLAA